MHKELWIKEILGKVFHVLVQINIFYYGKTRFVHLQRHKFMPGKSARPALQKPEMRSWMFIVNAAGKERTQHLEAKKQHRKGQKQGQGGICALLRPSLEQSVQFCSLISRLILKTGNILKKEGGIVILSIFFFKKRCFMERKFWSWMYLV